MPTRRTRAAFPRWSCSAATSPWACRDRLNMRGSCGRCCTPVTTRSRSADGRIRTAMPTRQVDYLASPSFHAEFYLTQVVSHHDLRAVERFLDAARRRELTLPAVFGVFFYRSANPRTLAALAELSARAGRRAHARVRGGRERRGCLRPHRADAAGCRRPPFLHQQPAHSTGAGSSRVHPRARGNRVPRTVKTRTAENRNGANLKSEV